jgi:N-acetylmuramoyl-L-alanine amidase
VHRNQTLPAFWHAYTEQQIASVFEVCRLLIDTFDIKFILGHEEISPGRKVDPGPAFPLDKLRELLLNGSRNEDGAEVQEKNEGIVTVDLLNIRNEPGTESEKVAKPLRKGQKVKVLASKSGWVKVRTEITGWVSEKFVQLK